MKNKRFGLGLLAMVLVFGITVFGCDIDGNGNGIENGKGNGNGIENGNGNGNVYVDGALYGTWSRTVILISEFPPHWKYCHNCIANSFQGGSLTPCDDCIWINETTNVTIEWVHELTFNDDNIFTMSTNGNQYIKGTYYTNNNKITKTPSHNVGPFGSREFHSKNEMEVLYKTLLDEGLLDGTGEDIGRRLNHMFASSTSGYSIKGNTLKITIDDETQKYNRKY